MTARKSAELHRLHGTRPEYPADSLPEGAELRAVELDPPPSLSPEAQAHFRRICGLAAELGTLTEQDRDAVGLLADVLAQIDECRQVVAERGQLIGDKRNPAASALGPLNGQATKLLHQLGLTPKGRRDASPPGSDRNPTDPKAAKAASMFSQ